MMRLPQWEQVADTGLPFIREDLSNIQVLDLTEENTGVSRESSGTPNERPRKRTRFQNTNDSISTPENIFLHHISTTEYFRTMEDEMTQKRRAFQDRMIENQLNYIRDSEQRDKELEGVKKKLESAEKKLEYNKIHLKAYRKDIAEARGKLEDTEKQLCDISREMEKTKKELVDARMELAMNKMRGEGECALCHTVCTLDAAFQPCGHAGFCKACGDECKNYRALIGELPVACPFCRQPARISEIKWV